MRKLLSNHSILTTSNMSNIVYAQCSSQKATEITARVFKINLV